MASLPGSEQSPDDSGSASPQAALGLSVAKASERLIERFGGIRPMASKLEVPVTTVQGWKKRGAIPPTRLNDLRAAARRHGIKLEEAELEAISRNDERSSPEAASKPAAKPSATGTEPPTRSPAPAPAQTPAQTPVKPAAPAATAPEPAAVPAAIPPVRTAAEIPAMAIPAMTIPPVTIPTVTIPPAPNPCAPVVGGPAPTVALRNGAARAIPEGPAPAAAAGRASPPAAAESPAPSAATQSAAPPASAESAAAPASAETMGSPASAETMGSPASAGRAKPAPRPAVTPIPAATSKSPPSPVRRDDGPAVSAPAPASGNGWAGLAIAAAVVALIGAGVAVTSPFWMPPPVGQPLTPAALQQRLGDLESKVSRIALEQGTSPTALDKRVGQVEATVARLEPDHAGLLSTLTGRVVALEKALPTLGQRLSGLPTSPPALAMLLSMVQLRSALATASPFQGELAALELSGGAGDPTVRSTIDQIAERAAIGIPTDGWLIERYPETMHNILRAATADDPIGGLFDQTLGLLSVVAPPLYRWTTNLDAASPRAVADRAEAWMAAGDLARAVDQLSTLTGRPAEAAAPWLAEARARVAADHARTLLGQRMIALVPGGAPAK